MKNLIKKFMMVILFSLLCINLSGCTIIDIAFEILNSYQNQENQIEYEYPTIDVDKIHTLSDLYEGVMPSKGNANVIVLLIEFPDEAHKTKYTPEFMNECFFGTNSVSSYYRESSFHKFNMFGQVFGWYKAKYSSSKYERLYGNYASDVIIKEALDYYISNGTISPNNYDGNSDGYIDAVYGIYSRKQSEMSNLWWAYQTTYQDEDTLEQYVVYDDVKFSQYVWASSQFFDSGSIFSKSADLSTIIHETGHLLGLDDYYDYDTFSGSNVGVGGADMMDYNVGDHMPISKMILGWVEPEVVTLNENKEYNLRSFTETGDVLIIPLQEYNSVFDEYLTVEFYTPTGLNKTNTYLTTYGVRLTYVNATLADGGMSGSYYTLFDHDNSDTDIPFVCMMTKTGPIKNDESASNKNLFQVNDNFVGKSIYYACEEYRNFEIKVVMMTSKEVTVSVSFN